MNPSSVSSNKKADSKTKREIMDRAFFRWAAKAMKEVKEKEKLEKVKEMEKQCEEVTDRIERRNKVMKLMQFCLKLHGLLSTLNGTSSLNDEDLNNLFTKLREMTDSSTMERIELTNVSSVIQDQPFKEILMEICVMVNICRQHVEMADSVEQLNTEYQTRLQTLNSLKNRLLMKMEQAESLLVQYIQQHVPQLESVEQIIDLNSQNVGSNMKENQLFKHM